MGTGFIGIGKIFPGWKILSLEELSFTYKDLFVLEKTSRSTFGVIDHLFYEILPFEPCLQWNKSEPTVTGYSCSNTHSGCCYMFFSKCCPCLGSNLQPSHAVLNELPVHHIIKTVGSCIWNRYPGRCLLFGSQRPKS